ncbi:MAG: DUF4129 domain-containing protein [Hamadaea sp.]|nr:DUF4129 domain-containing protein [Hamadaea sp.]
MSRAWTEFVAAVSDVIPLPLLLLILVLITGIAAALWHFYPAWLPRRRTGARRSWRWHWPRLRWPRWRRLRWPWRRKKKSGSAASLDEQVAELAASDEELPAVPVAVYQSLADRLAAEGRYAEALRERYRSAVRDLVQHGVIDNRPGWTVTELARAAASARPAVDAPLLSASALFSEVWYAERAATAEHDERMRGLAEDVHTHLGGRS